MPVAAGPQVPGDGAQPAGRLALLRPRAHATMRLEISAPLFQKRLAFSSQTPEKWRRYLQTHRRSTAPGRSVPGRRLQNSITSPSPCPPTPTDSLVSCSPSVFAAFRTPESDSTKVSTSHRDASDGVVKHAGRAAAYTSGKYARCSWVATAPGTLQCNLYTPGSAGGSRACSLPFCRPVRAHSSPPRT
jgi:hypothetical protein